MLLAKLAYTWDFTILYSVYTAADILTAMSDLKFSYKLKASQQTLSLAILR